MKKILILFLSVFLLCSMTACKNPEKGAGNKINVVCTVFPQYDFVRQIAEDRVNLTMLLPPGTEAHSYEPSPRDIITLKEADLFIAIGGESEHWALHLLEGEEIKNTPSLFLIENVTAYTEEHKVGMETSGHSHGHKHSDECEHTDEEYDEHIWTSPDNAILMCEAIAKALKNADPENASFYDENAKEYIGKLKILYDEYKSVCRTAPKNTIIFGDRFPMRYLTESLGLNYYAAFPGCSSKTEPSVNTVVYLTEKMKKENISVIFYMDYSDGRVAKTIARECDAKAMRLYSCHSLSKSDFEKGETYISLMQKNLNSIKEALS